MILAGWYDNPAVVGLIIGIPASVFAFLGWRRSSRQDADAKQREEEHRRTAHVTETREGMESIIAALQDDNKVLRGNQRRLETRVEALEREIRRLRGENRELRAEEEANGGRIDKLENREGP